jgi:hypothetical protein
MNFELNMKYSIQENKPVHGVLSVLLKITLIKMVISLTI